MKSLHHLLSALEQQDSWRSRREFHAVLGCWFEVVGAMVASHSRPVSIQRQVLQVATSSPVWAQTLAFERHHILQKLNQRLPLGLVDIRFSTAHWSFDPPAPTAPDATTLLWQNHPSFIGEKPVPPVARSKDAMTAFQRWAAVMKARSQHLPKCPRCQAPTPEGELKRWSVCSLCISKEWSELDPKNTQK